MDRFPEISVPDWGFGSGAEAKVTRSSFGDGYEIRRPSGLNHVTESWSPSWSSLSPTEAHSLYSWLKARLNWKAFLWEHPVSGVEFRVVCTGVSLTDEEFGRSTVSANFTEDHNPQ